MANYITVDMGTSNTRVGLIRDGQIISTLYFSMGVGKGQPLELSSALHSAVISLLQETRLQEKDITCILASGMITSEKGLCPLAHIVLPTGISALQKNLHQTTIPHISPIPFCFIRGVQLRNAHRSVQDVMRGEETELMGIWTPDFTVYVLPGSHTKMIQTDEAGNILSFSSSLSGEMLSALSKGTILSASIDLDQPQFDTDYLLKGYDRCARGGLNASLMQVRLLDTQAHKSKKEIYSFFLGMILHGDVQEILRFHPDRLLIGGKKQMRLALACLLENRTSIRPSVLSDQEVEESVFRGAVKIYEHR